MVRDALLELYIENGHGCFGSSYRWIKEMVGTLFCPHCRNVYESIRQIEAVVNNKEQDRESDVDLVFGGAVEVLSTHFIGIVGPELLSCTTGLGRILNERGFEYKNHRTAIALKDNVVVRGPEDKLTVRGRGERAKKSRNIGLCEQCERLLYWPIGGKYVIRRELPEWPVFLSDGHVFCTPEFYEKCLRSASLRHVAIEEIPIRDEPLDGLPASTAELRTILKARQQFK